jgi:hypothetical protein
MLCQKDLRFAGKYRKTLNILRRVRKQNHLIDKINQKQQNLNIKLAYKNDLSAQKKSGTPKAFKNLIFQFKFTKNCFS